MLSPRGLGRVVTLNDVPGSALQSALDDKVKLGRISLTLGPPAILDARQWDALELENGQVAVLRREPSSLAIYDSVGTLIQEVADPDGHVASPMALVAAAGVLHVADQRSGLVGLSAGSDGTMTYSTPTEVGEPFRDACSADSTLIVYANRPATRELLRSWKPGSDDPGDLFGAVYDYPARLPANRVGQGKAHCIPSARLVVAALDYVPRVYGFDLESRSLFWFTDFAGLVPARILELGNGGITMEPAGDGTWHLLARLAGGGTWPLLVQYARLDSSLGRRQSGYHYSVDSFALDPANGRGWFMGSDLPEVLYVEGTLMVTIERGPDAHLAFWRVQPPEEWRSGR